MKDYVFIIVPIFTLILCQLIKFTLESFHCKKLKWGRLFNGSGGMPSSHTSFAYSLTFTIAYRLGITSPIFAVALIFSLIVSYDAMGVRMESGRQAAYINQIIDKIFEGTPATWGKKLKEELGHKPMEVFVGIIFSITCAWICNLWFDIM